MRLTALSRPVLRQYCHSRKCPSLRPLHCSTRLLAVKPFLLADIGEGIRECEVIQWFVQPDARVEEFDKICEVQSDKASVEIPSRFSGVIKKLHYEAGEMAIVGKPLVDIDVEEEIEDEPALAQPADVKNTATASNSPDGFMARPSDELLEQGDTLVAAKKGKHASLATPAVRHLTKELDVIITDVTGTGRDGRVTKDDVHKFAAARDSPSSQNAEPSPSQSYSSLLDHGPQKETPVTLTNMQSQMFKTMTRSLSIPHFLYADEIDFTSLFALRARLNALAETKDKKLSYVPFVIKAMSLALHRYPILNARVDIDSTSSKPSIVLRAQHNIGVAMDTPSGLLVPVIKNVSSLSLSEIATELSRLQSLASSNKLTSSDLSGGTITLSNIGSIGGTYVSPVIVEKEVSILGMGKIRTVPAFGEDGELVAKKMVAFSWSADHRVVDGATMARAAEVVRKFVEMPDEMLVHLR